MNFGPLIRFYWNHCIAVTCAFKLGGVYMSISRRVKCNATTSILNIMAPNYRSEFYFCLRDWSEDFFTTTPLFQPTLLSKFGKIPNSTSSPNPLQLFQTPRTRLLGTIELGSPFWKPVKMTIWIYIKPQFIAQYFPKFFSSMSSSTVSYVVNATPECTIPVFLSELNI